MRRCSSVLTPSTRTSFPRWANPALRARTTSSGPRTRGPSPQRRSILRHCCQRVQTCGSVPALLVCGMVCPPHGNGRCAPTALYAGASDVQRVWLHKASVAGRLRLCVQTCRRTGASARTHLSSAHVSRTVVGCACSHCSRFHGLRAVVAVRLTVAEVGLVWPKVRCTPFMRAY